MCQLVNHFERNDLKTTCKLCRQTVVYLLLTSNTAQCLRSDSLLYHFPAGKEWAESNCKWCVMSKVAKVALTIMWCHADDHLHDIIICLLQKYPLDWPWGRDQVPVISLVEMLDFVARQPHSPPVDGHIFTACPDVHWEPAHSSYTSPADKLFQCEQLQNVFLCGRGRKKVFFTKTDALYIYQCR